MLAVISSSFDNIRSVILLGTSLISDVLTTTDVLGGISGLIGGGLGLRLGFESVHVYREMNKNRDFEV